MSTKYDNNINMKPNNILKKQNKIGLLIAIIVIFTIIFLILIFGGYLNPNPNKPQENKIEIPQDPTKSLNAPDNGSSIKKVPNEVIDSLSVPETSPAKNTESSLDSKEQDKKNQELINSMTAPSK